MSAKKYLDLAGLTAYDAKIKAYADAVAASAAAGKVTLEAVNALPAVADAQQNVVYLVPNSSSGDNVKDEYILVNGAFEKIGTTKADVDGKISKVTSPTAGHFPKLKADGSLEDSGKGISDFATAAQGAKADTALQPADMVPITYSGSGNEIDALFATTSTLTISGGSTALSDWTVEYTNGMTWAEYFAANNNYVELGNSELYACFDTPNVKGCDYQCDEFYLLKCNGNNVVGSDVIDSSNTYSW